MGIDAVKGEPLLVGISHGKAVLVDSGVGVGGAMLTVMYRSARISTVAQAPRLMSTPPQVTTKPDGAPATRTTSIPIL